MALQQLIPGLREVVQKMAEGEVSDPIQLPGGIHIVKVVDVREAQAQPLAQVEDQLRAALRTQRQQQAARAYLEGLINGGTVSIDGGEVNAAFEAASHPAVSAASPLHPRWPFNKDDAGQGARVRLNQRIRASLGYVSSPRSVAIGPALLDALQDSLTPERLARLLPNPGPPR